MLKQLDENLWIYDEAASVMGFECGARMTLIRLSSGQVFIHSPLEISPELQREIDAIGEVAFVVSPYRYHFMGLEPCAKVYPGAKYYAAPGMDTRKYPSIAFAGVLSETPEPEWEGELDQTLIRGNHLDNEVVFFHAATKTVIATDLCFNTPASTPPFTRFMARLLGTYQNFAPTLNFKIFTRNRTLVRQSINRILAWDFDRVIISHGDIVETGGKEKIRGAFTWLRR